MRKAKVIRASSLYRHLTGWRLLVTVNGGSPVVLCQTYKTRREAAADLWMYTD